MQEAPAETIRDFAHNILYGPISHRNTVFILIEPTNRNLSIPTKRKPSTPSDRNTMEIGPNIAETVGRRQLFPSTQPNEPKGCRFEGNQKHTGYAIVNRLPTTVCVGRQAIIFPTLLREEVVFENLDLGSHSRSCPYFLCRRPRVKQLVRQCLEKLSAVRKAAGPSSLAFLGFRRVHTNHAVSFEKINTVSTHPWSVLMKVLAIRGNQSKGEPAPGAGCSRQYQPTRTDTVSLEASLSKCGEQKAESARPADAQVRQVVRL